jgi:hypothetical protein
MKPFFSTLLFLFIFTLGFSQNNKKIIGNWKFKSVTSTNQECKDVDYFPIYTFNFKVDGTAEFKSEEGIAQSDYRLRDNFIELFNLSENGIKQEGTAQFIIKSISDTSLIISVDYECGSIDIIFIK